MTVMDLQIDVGAWLARDGLRSRAKNLKPRFIRYNPSFTLATASQPNGSKAVIATHKTVYPYR